MIQQLQPRTPDSVELARIALTAGAAGHTVALGFRDFAPSALGLIWANLCRRFKAENVRHVFTAKDAPQSAKDFRSSRLILVYDSRLVGPICWHLAIQPKPGRDTKEPVPTVLFLCETQNFPDQPLPTLVLDGHHEETAHLQSWHLHQAVAGTSEDDCDRHVSGVDISEQFRNALFSRSDNRPVEETRLQEILVVEALLVGTRVRELAAKGSTRSVNDPIKLDDYERLFGLLDRLVGRTPDDEVDPLASAMVKRANEYLEAVCPEDEESRDRKQGGNTASDETSPITRRQLADLGNVRSTEVRQVIEHIHSLDVSKHRHRLCMIGLVRDLPEGWTWPDADAVKAIRPLLLTWSPKQVITHFHRLYDDGLIAAERPSGNKAWVYRLPASLVPSRKSFAGLPRPDALRAALATDSSADQFD